MRRVSKSRETRRTFDSQNERKNSSHVVELIYVIECVRDGLRLDRANIIFPNEVNDELNSPHEIDVTAILISVLSQD